MSFKYYTDNPARNVDRYTADLEEKASKRPECCQCGCTIYDKAGYKLGEKWYCIECMEEFKTDILEDDEW